MVSLTHCVSAPSRVSEALRTSATVPISASGPLASFLPWLSPNPPSPPPPNSTKPKPAARRAIFRLVYGFLVVLVIVVTVQWITDSEDTTGAGEPLPDLVYTTLDGQDFPILSIEGQPTVVNFFASWCAPCRAEMPDFEEVHLATTGEVAFIGVNTRETDLDSARDVVEDTGVTYTILLGDDGGPGSLYQHVTDLAVMPTTAFIDADGTIVEVHSGVLNAEDLQDRIQEYFG